MSEPLPSQIGGGEDDDDDVSGFFFKIHSIKPIILFLFSSLLLKLANFLNLSTKKK